MASPAAAVKPLCDFPPKKSVKVSIFDVGVAQGTPDLYRAFPEAVLVLVEPLQEFVSHMRVILEQHQGFMYLTAAGEGKGEVTLNIYPDARKTSHYKKIDARMAIVEMRKVPIIRLDNIAADHQFPTPYLVKVDVEGDELSVLKGASFVLTQAEVLVLEMSVAKRFDGEAGFAEIVSFLESRGFRLCDIIGAADTPRGLLKQMDLAFLRGNGKLAKRVYCD